MSTRPAAAFAQEQHSSRYLFCGWPHRAETAVSIARRLRVMVRRLREIDRRLELLWPQFARRAIRLTDPGPVLELSDEQLGDLIDRRGRFDPPRYPAPVDPWGYSFAIGGCPKRSLLRDYGGIIAAGRYGSIHGNEMDIRIDQDHAVWRDPCLAYAALGILIESWEAQWACATGRRAGIIDDTIGRPFLTWRSATISEIPRTFADIGPPAETRPLLGGELQIWP